MYRNTTKTTAAGDIEGFCLELQRFIETAERSPSSMAKPLETYVGELGRILRSHLEIGKGRQ